MKKFQFIIDLLCICSYNEVGSYGKKKSQNCSENLEISYAYLKYIVHIVETFECFFEAIPT